MLDIVFMRIWDMSKIASMVIVAVLLVRLCLKRAPKVISYALWTVVLFRLLCPVTVETAVSILPEVEPVSERYTLADEPITVVGAVEAAYQAVGDALNGGLGVQHIRTAATDDNGLIHYATSTWWEVWILLGQYVWLAGIAVMLIRAAVQTVKLRRQLMGAVPLDGRVYLADHIDSPFVMGLIRPRIYLPSSLGEHEREYILLHERHHIRRGDHLMRALSFLALCLHWFNPLVWVAFILSGRDMEMSCDEAVVGKLGGDIRVDYAASLLRLSTGRRPIAPTPLAFGEGNTGGRIRNLARWKKPIVIVVVIAVIVCSMLAVCVLTDPIIEKHDRLAGAFYRAERLLYPDVPVLYGDFASSEHNRYAGEIEQFCITADMHLYLSFDDDDPDYQGALEPYEMSERMTELVGEKVTEAYILRFEVDESSFLKAGDFLLFMQTRSGKTLYAFGWEDVSERDDVYSDDTNLYVLYTLESMFEEEVEKAEFFGLSLIHSVEQPYACLNVFEIAEMPGYAIVGFAASMSDPEHMSDMGYAVFKAYGGKKGYRLLDWHVYPDAAVEGNGIYMAEDPAVLSESGKMTDRNTYDVILSANADLAKIVRHGEDPGRGVVAVIDSAYSMTVFARRDFDASRTVWTKFFNAAGDRIFEHVDP